LPGDVGLYMSEYTCAQNLPTPGYASSINAAELTDGQRSGLFTCATFTGSFDGPNQVYAWRSQDDYQATTYINNGRPGELYITGGDVPPAKGLIPPGPYVAKADATSGREIWRTYLENGNTADVWVASTNLNTLANGNIVTSWSNRIALLDADTGLVIATNTLPTGPVAVRDTTFKHVTVAPDGTLIVKNQSRPEGCTLQGTLAIINCTQQGMKQGPSTLVAVDPDTLEVLASVTLPEPSTVPHIISMLGDKIAIYLGVDSGALRYFWDPEAKTLTQDESWVIKPMKEGQSTSDAPSLIGDWIVLQTNGIGSNCRNER
jgi:outer membrane protein assembly factor BamB